MRKISYLVALIVIACLFHNVSQAQMRNFTESNGRIIEAELLGFNDPALAAIPPQQNAAPQHPIPRPAVANQVTEEMKLDGWVSIFDGRTLTGWRPNKQYAGFRVQDGCIVGFGEINHLYYMAEQLKNFELLIDAQINNSGNSGIFVKTQWEDKSFPVGFEVQINNSHHDLQKTGSLYNFVKIDKAPHEDDEWFTFHIICRGSTIECRFNGNTLYIHVDRKGNTPPREPVTRQNMQINQRGYIALQQHDPGSAPMFKNIFLKKLPD